MEHIDPDLRVDREEKATHVVAPAAPAELREWPPPPHDPRERVPIAELDGWEVRSFRIDGVKHRYFAARGMLHLQLWHPHAAVSLLTPSRLTVQRYEAYPIAGWKFAHGELRALRGIVRGQHGIELPSAAAIRALERWYVARLSRAAARPVPVSIGESDS